MGFAMRNINLAGRAVPAIIVGDPVTEQVQLPDRTTVVDGVAIVTPGKKIPGQFADMISLRETNPDGPNPGQKYLVLSHENLRFCTLRTTPVVGLDVDDTGALLTIEELEARRQADIQARQIARLAAQAPTTAGGLGDLTPDTLTEAGL